MTHQNTLLYYRNKTYSSWRSDLYLLPGAHILPHSGVTNRALVLHFPLVGTDGVRVRVGDEWRRYEVGRTMVFDDSFEHEVIHGGSRTRYVLFAVLHHPGLGTPSIGGAVKSEL